MKYTAQTVAETPKEKYFTFLKCERSHMHELTDLHIYSVQTHIISTSAHLQHSRMVVAGVFVFGSCLDCLSGGKKR